MTIALLVFEVALARSFTFLPILFYSLTPSARSIQEHTDVNQCVCPGNKLIYRCTVQGSPTGATIWNGTAFSGCLQNEILLQHGGFTPTGGPTGTCNNGAIVGQSLGVQDSNYTSQLSLTITPDTVGKTITCAYDALTTTQDSIIIRFSTIVPGQLQPPEKLHLSTANFILGCFTFTWSPVAPDCPIHYNILASNCGSCPTTTNHTNVTCTGIPTDGSVCAFAVQTVACGNLAGNFSGMVTTYILSNTNDNGTVISSTLLVLLLIVYVTVSILIYIILVKGKLAVKHQLEQANELLKVNSKSCRVPQQRDEAIDTTDNTAYNLHAYD